MGTGRCFRFVEVSMSNMLINKWEVIVRTKRHWVLFLHRGGGGKRKDLWMRDEHEHGKSEENN